MPPKKRTSTVANADTTTPSSKRTRKPTGSQTAAASRPKRFPQLPPRAAKTRVAAPAPKPSPAKRTASAAKVQAQETPRKRGRPVATTTSLAVKKEDAFGPDRKSYWLMKAEPESRIVKGVDVKFSIDDLQAATEPEPWDGVRNPVARNNMRAMKQGDYAFFYHSSCKVPGIVGQMEIVKEHSVDESAFDPEHPYYDEKSSRENPKWECVHVEFRRKFDQPVTLETLKSYALSGQALENMQTLRQSRVSVSRVSPQEWNFIMGLVDKQEADAKKAAARGAAKETKAAAKEAAAKEQANAEMKDAAESETEVNGQAETENTDEAPKEPSTEAPAPEEPAAEPDASSTLACEPSVPAPVEQPAKDVFQPENRTEDQTSKPEDAQIDREKSTESGINGQSTAGRITSVFTGAFLAN